MISKLRVLVPKTVVSILGVAIDVCADMENTSISCFRNFTDVYSYDVDCFKKFRD